MGMEIQPTGALPLSTFGNLLAATSAAATGSGSAGSTSSAGSAGGTSSSGSAGAANALDQLSNPQMFLQLLVAELQNQDPTSPTSPSTILAQTSELAQMEAVTTQTSAITAAQTSTEDSEATGLVGRSVTATVSGSTITGVVTDAHLTSSGTPTLTVNGTTFPLADVTDVSSGPSTPSAGGAGSSAGTGTATTGA